MAPKISFQMTPATKKALQSMRNLLTVGELKFNANLGAEIIAKEARLLAPPGKTGRLKRGIVAKEDKNASMFTGDGVAYVGVDYGIAPHAHLVEFGARGGAMPAHPFMRPAIDSKQAEAAKAMEDDLLKRISLRMERK